MAKTRHHYIPAFYLKWFNDPALDNRVWMYDKNSGKVVDASPNDIARIKHFHSFLNETGERDTESIERVYEAIESPAGVLFKKIHEATPLDDEDKATFAMFATSMMVRVPNYRQNFEKMSAELISHITKGLAHNQKAFNSHFGDIQEKIGDTSNFAAEDMRQLILNDGIKVSVNPQASLAMSVSNLMSMSDIFHQMHWHFIRATDYKFLTGDNPLYYCDPTHNPNSFYGVGLSNKNIEVTLPLSRELCAVGGWSPLRKFSTIQGTSQMVKIINHRTARAALTYIFASENTDSLARMVGKYKGTAPTFKIN